jgi:hypothetical protein
VICMAIGSSSRIVSHKRAITPTAPAMSASSWRRCSYEQALSLSEAGRVWPCSARRSRRRAAVGSTQCGSAGVHARGAMTTAGVRCYRHRLAQWRRAPTTKAYSPVCVIAHITVPLPPANPQDDRYRCQVRCLQIGDRDQH